MPGDLIRGVSRNSPIAGYARTECSGEPSLRAAVFTPDGKTVPHAHEWAGRLDPAALGPSVAVALLRQDARELIDGIAHWARRDRASGRRILLSTPPRAGGTRPWPNTSTLPSWRSL